MAPTVQHVQQIRLDSDVKTVLAQERSGLIVVLLQDVQDVFEGAKRLEYDGICVPFLTDENEKRIEPHQVEYHADIIYDVILGPADDDDILGPADESDWDHVTYGLDNTTHDFEGLPLSRIELVASPLLPELNKVNSFSIVCGSGSMIDDIQPKDGDGSHWVSKMRSILRRKKEDIIRIKNETNTVICIVCTQDLVSVLDNGGAGLNAGATGVDLRLDIAKALVGVKEIKSVLKLGPNETQDVMAASKFTTVSVFKVDGGTVQLLFKNALLKRGRQLTVEQRDVDYALGDHELAMINI
ncbi:hypothetical protein BGZ80_001583 [Entomortierella chlamydospora]|uniref:Uncharacterized protein n=1 Tax=Entomortierella chlamydospora TaxID=101097 RepID=A0A9P6SXN8_9FUNG|nr:hypothetical protein BGZ79_001458 [Entomortierella chlamydospora]KAG0010332.1 hypothetical protein BGZ80_001583 [Entomortierella chlamydospora]